MAKAKGTPVRAFAIFLLAAVIGAAGGLLGSGFQLGLNWIQQTLTLQETLPDGSVEPLSRAVHDLPWWRVLAVPTIGGLAAGLLLLLLGRQKPPFGISDIIGIVQLRQGVLRLRHGLVQILSSACTIGSGGSIGREGANSHIAATVASLLGRAFRVNSRSNAVLLGCGIAAGMATSYNSPIAGAIFVMEVVLGNFAMDVFAPIVVASVMATMLRHVVLGEQAVYADVLQKDLGVLSWYLVLAALLLGVVCGAGGLLFRGSLQLGKRLFAKLALPRPLALGLGGLAIGAIGLFMPETWGNGIEVIKMIGGTVAETPPSLGLIASLFVWKVIATSLTVGSGGLGGIFTPNLVIGAAFGVFFAHALEWPTGGTPTPQETATFAFVGMAGLTAATMHAPVTSVVLVFELTGHYELVLPVMLCSIVASIVASMLDEDSYYSAALKAKGTQLPKGLEELAIKTTYVRDVMRVDTVTVRDTAGFDEVMHLLANHRGDTVYAVDAQGALVGRVQLQDVKNFINDPTLAAVVIASDLTRPSVTVHPDDSLASVMPRFDDPEIVELAVTTDTEPPRLVGRVRHQDVITGISSEVLGSQRIRTHFLDDSGKRTAGVDLPSGYELATLPVPDAWVGHAIDALPPSELHEVVVVVVVDPAPADGQPTRRAATPDVILQSGQQIVVLATAMAIRRLRTEGA